MKNNITLIFLLLIVTLTEAQQSKNRDKGNVNHNENNSIIQKATKPQNILPIAKLKKGRNVELSVNVLSNQKADTYVAIFNLTQMGKTVEETNKLLTDRYNGFFQGLQTVGIPKDNIYIDMVTFVPVYEYEKEKKIFTKTHNEAPKGFEMQQNVHVKYNDPKMMVKIMSVAVKYEIYDLVKVDCSVNSQELVYVEMRTKAVSHLVNKIELFEEKLGIDLESGYRIVAENKKAIFPIDRYLSYSAFSNVSLGGTPDKGKVLDMYKPKTLYYDKVTYDEFDLIINPDVLEPAIQFMYNMKVQIVLNDTEKPAKEYFWLTPDGDKVPVTVK